MHLPDIRIETERLILRQPQAGGFEGWAAFFADVTRRLGSSILRRIEMPEPFSGEIVDVWGQRREAWLRRRA